MISERAGKSIWETPGNSISQRGHISFVDGGIRGLEQLLIHNPEIGRISDIPIFGFLHQVVPRFPEERSPSRLDGERFILPNGEHSLLIWTRDVFPSAVGQREEPATHPYAFPGTRIFTDRTDPHGLFRNESSELQSD